MARPVPYYIFSVFVFNRKLGNREQVSNKFMLVSKPGMVFRPCASGGVVRTCFCKAKLCDRLHIRCPQTQATEIPQWSSPPFLSSWKLEWRRPFPSMTDIVSILLQLRHNDLPFECFTKDFCTFYITVNT